MEPIFSLGQWIKRRRKARDLTQEALAQLVGCSKDLIVKIEGDARRPSRQVAERIADHLQLAPDERIVFLQAARAELSPEHLAPPSRSVPQPSLVPPAALPQGTVTFLFSDIVGSTRLWQQHPQAMGNALTRHTQLLRAAITQARGVIFKTVGDGLCAAFANARDAITAATEGQRALAREPWDGLAEPFRVRMALHTGVVEQHEGDYEGLALSHVARLVAVAHGGQVLLSQVTHELVRDQLPPDMTMHDLGVHRLKDLPRAEPLYQLVAPELHANFPPLPTLDARRDNLPVQPTPLIGREREVEAVSALLRRPEVRLITLTGPGGTGKTRLGIQVVAECRNQYSNGVWFVDLAPITDPARVADAVLQSLDVPQVSGLSSREQLLAWLQAKRLLLFLDNFEQVVDAAEFVGAILRQASGVRILVTSRTPLRLRHEHEYAVGPLALPEPQQLLPPEQLRQYDAVALFIARAQAIQRGFEITDANAAAVAEICTRLDGLPLAIELAAAQIRLLKLEQLLTRLKERGILGIATAGARDLPARQQTMRAMVDWSYQLLDDNQRRLFGRLAVFSGGWTLEAAEAVCSDDRLDVFDGLGTLVEHSLVQRGESNDEPRFVMLEPIREYAVQCLHEQGEEEWLRERHLDYYVTLAETAEPKLRSGEQLVWLVRLDAESDNLRAALSWALAAQGTDTARRTSGLRLAVALWCFWLLRNRINESLHWLDGNWASDPALPAALRARAIVVKELVVGWFEGIRHHRRWLTDAGLAFVRDSGDLSTQAMALADLAFFKNLLVGLPALDYAEESRTLAAQTDDPWVQAYAQLGYGSALSYVGDHREEGLRELRVGLEMLERTGERWLASCGYWTAGMLLLEKEDYAGAQQAFEAELLLCDQLSSQLGRTYGLWGLSVVATNEGDLTLARFYHYEHIQAEMAVGNVGSGFFSRLSAGETALDQGDFASAEEHFRQAEAALTVGVEPLHHRYPQSRFDLAVVRGTFVELALARGDIGAAQHSLSALRQVTEQIRHAPWATNETYRGQMEQLHWRETFLETRIAFARGDLEYAQRRLDSVLSDANADALLLCGQMAARSGDHRAAIQWLERALASVTPSWSGRWKRACVQLELGRVLVSSGDTLAARAAFQQCLPLLRRAAALPRLAKALEGVAGVRLKGGQPESAARLWGAAEALRDQLGAPMWPVDRPEYEMLMAEARAHLSSEIWDAAWIAGRELSWEQAVKEALLP